MKAFFPLLLGLFLLGMGCRSAQSETSRHLAPADAGLSASSEVEPSVDNQSLVEYLRQVPGVQVSGNGGSARVRIRGLQSLDSRNTSPLFIIEGSRYSSLAQVIPLVSPNDIRGVRVLRDVASLTEYGMAGQNGVVIIKLKQ